MEEILKELQGKNLTKKKIFDFLSDINFEKILDKTHIHIETKEEEKVVEEFKCEACMKSFANKSSLKRHHDRFIVCKNWIELPEKTDTQFSTGIHHIIDDILEKSITDTGEPECKFCKTKFISKGNHHKHFNTSTVCNRLAFIEFKKIMNSL